MEPLQTSHHNLDSWSVYDDPVSGDLLVKPAQKAGAIFSIIFATVLLIFAFWVGSRDAGPARAGMLAAGAWILGMTGVLVPVVIIGYGLGQQKKGALLRYRVEMMFWNCPV